MLTSYQINSTTYRLVTVICKLNKHLTFIGSLLKQIVAQRLKYLWAEGIEGIEEMEETKGIEL